MKYITQAPTGRIKPVKDTSNICPTCGEYCIGSVATRYVGFFAKPQRKKSYSCWKCNTKWHTGWKDKE